MSDDIETNKHMRNNLNHSETFEATPGIEPSSDNDQSQ